MYVFYILDDEYDEDNDDDEKKVSSSRQTTLLLYQKIQKNVGNKFLCLFLQFRFCIVNTHCIFILFLLVRMLLNC